MRFVALTTVVVASLCASLVWGQGAATYPNKTVKLVVPVTTGGPSDLVARVLADKLSTSLKQPFIVENKAGASQVVGSDAVAKSPPDGYTLLQAAANMAINPVLMKNLPYDTLKDFEPVMLIATSPYGLVVPAGSPYKTLAELITAARAKPGDLTLGSSGQGSRGHLGMTLLEKRAEFRTTQVSYRGPALIMNDLMGNQITMQMGTVFFVAPFVKSGKVRALGVTSAQRLAQLPDVPTIAEQGFPGYEVNSWWAIVAPAGVPGAIAKQMHAALVQTMATPQLRERLEQLGMTVIASSPEDLARTVQNEMKLWGPIAAEIKRSAN